MNYFNKEIVVIGLGYVGLPLAIRLSSYFKVIGYDISESRVKELSNNIDRTKEVSSDLLKKAHNLKITSSIEHIDKKYIYIVTVPTPVNKNKLPDLALLKSACELVGKVIAKEAIIIFESTVYPGVTEEICAPIISKQSNFVLNSSFYVGYSPERINPGDKEHTVDKITKVVSGSNKKITKVIGKIYESSITAGIFYAKNIRVAETAKAIENAQRDINIAFINEIALLCQKLDLSIYDVLEAARTKWNFLSFKPGLVGGHCIGVDPYYLSHVAKTVGYDTDVILAGRNLNDKMTGIIFKKIKKLILKNNRILQIGISFKENVPDIRNSKAAELSKMFIKNGYDINIFDPIVNCKDVESEYGINLSELSGIYDCIIITVPHKFISHKWKYIKKHLRSSSIIFDITGQYRKILSKKNIRYWSL